ncbi:MAG: peptidoglycan editing factor PgeF [Nitrospinaceae bacterium]
MNAGIHSLFIDLLKKKSGLVHAFSSRHRGKENGEKEELVFSRQPQSDVERRHRRWFLRSIGIDDEEVFLPRQVHGDRVYVLKDPMDSPEQVASVEADALVTHLLNRPIGVLTADCVPIVLYDSRLHVAGVIHAGRKGTSKNIFSKTIAALHKEYGSRVEHIFAGMGPAIGGCCYEVDEACVEPFRKNYPQWQKFAAPSSGKKFMLDLFQANEEDARAAGLNPHHLARLGLCTSCENHRFYSYRREGSAGRMMSVAMLRSL